MNAAPDIATGRSPTRTRSSSRRTSSSADRARPGAGRQALADAQPRSVGARRRDDPLRQPHRALLPSRSGDPRGGRDPGIVESIRAGLAFALKDAVGSRRDPPPRARLRAPRAALVGAQPAHRDPRQHELERLAIVSLGLRHPARPACTRTSSSPCSATCSASRRAAAASAPGPYIHRMLPIDEQWSQRMDAEVAKGHVGAKLAFTRLTFNYFISEAVFDYIVDAVHLLAREGWKLLPLYRFDPDSGALASPRRAARPHATSPPRCRAAAAVRHRARERAGRAARGGTPGHRRGRRPRRRRAPCRPGAERGVRAHPLVPAPR